MLYETKYGGGDIRTIRLLWD